MQQRDLSISRKTLWNINWYSTHRHYVRNLTPASASRAQNVGVRPRWSKEAREVSNEGSCDDILRAESSRVPVEEVLQQ